MTLFEEIEVAIWPLEGWCTPEKAQMLAALIIDALPALCVEIGVHGGKSLIPQAMALRQTG
ncbi:MAG: hypothetical protein HYX68_28910 [Planctomycetes bacterium]|nr:hypothetical protein [Planctomycetota bacterium]